ncbi:MAG: threonine/serine exporter family protein [Microbacterium sp.]|nr:threonine/serine exporter family protein [Microbacterium sp.]
MSDRGLVRRLREALRGRTAPAVRPTTRPQIGLPEMLGAVGAALLGSSRATSAVERILHELSSAYGRDDVQSFVLPTLVLVEDPSAGSQRTELFPATHGDLRLDQAGAVERLIERARMQRMPPADVVRELERIRATPPRFNAVTMILGHALLTVGFGLVLDPVALALPFYAVLGAIVGTVVVLTARFAQLSLVLPVLIPFGITLGTGLFVAPLIGDDPIRLVAPALVSLLPGLTLTLAAVELTSNQVVAGASRMVYGVARLGLLVFGVFAAISILGVHPAENPLPPLGAWAPWVGVVLTAIGYTLFSVAPRGAFPWIVVSLVVAYGAQVLGALAIGAQLSGFVGAVVVIVVVGLLRRIPAAPPSAVMPMCAYWLLVPGALGFIGLSRVAEGTDGAGAADLVVGTLVSLVSIALGMVVGAGMTREVDVVARGWRRVARVRSSGDAPAPGAEPPPR